jgi:beta-lactamase regulating signal transducer with metallopeptidase domain/protocatechuate 3,4-dioxygenase beta subunit
MKAFMLTWMFQSAVLGGGLVTAGCFLAARCRSPVRRLRLLDWTLIAALTAPVLASTEWPWQLPVRWLPTRPDPTVTTTTAATPLETTPLPANPALAVKSPLAEDERETGGPRVAAAPPHPREPADRSWKWPEWRDVVLVIEAVVIALLAAKWLVSALALACLSYGAKALDARLVARIAEQLPARLRPSATIGLDPNVSTPCVFGLFWPCILLPEFLVHANRDQQMIFALAHESSHLLRGDLWSWRLVRFAQFALWFQPAYWWLRRQTRLCQDFLADQDATMVGKPADLADFLVQLARMQQSRLTFTALSMRSHRKDLFRRINLLLHPHHQLECRCPRRFHAFVVLAVFAIIGMAAVLRLEAQDRARGSKAQESQSIAGRGSESNQASTTQVRGRVVDPDGRPVSGAKLYLRSVPVLNTGQRFLRSYRLGYEEMSSAIRATSESDGHFSFTFSNAELMAMDREDPTQSRVQGVVGEVMAIAPAHGCGWAEIDSAAGELTIHLVDDVPVEGRVLDSDGHTVTGAKIRMVGIGAAPREDLIAFLTAIDKKGFAFEMVWNGSLPCQPTITTTGRDGRFRLTGIGRDRLINIWIEGPTIASAFSWVMTRRGETLKVLDGRATFFPASFDFVGQPSRLISGTVRNKATGKPMAGVSVKRMDGEGLPRSVTDGNGRYELRGFVKAPTYLLTAAAGDGVFFDHEVNLRDTPGLDTLSCDIELVTAALTVHGRVREKDTGKPVAGAQVDYHPVVGNAYAHKLLPGFWRPRSETTALSDGSYTLTVMPGPGVIGVKAPKRNAYAPAVATLEDRKKAFKTPAVFSDPLASKEDDVLMTAANGSGGIFVEFYNALVLIEPSEDEHALVRDVALERPREIKGKILGPDNQPLTGATVYGLIRFGVETLKGSEFTVRGVNPKAKRPLVFYHKEKQLGYYLKDLGAGTPGSLTIKLQPCGSASGRIVDEDGQPVARQEVHICGNTFRAGRGEASGGYHRVVTDKNGRFHVAGLVAGQHYFFAESFYRIIPRFYGGVTVEPGQDKDLGDIKMKESMK